MPKQEHWFPCDTCGADMRFDPDAAELQCDNCGNREPLARSTYVPEQIGELDFRDAIDADIADVDLETIRVLSCPNCGAQVEFDAAQHAAECPFCATPMVTDTGEHRQIKPRGILPFSVSESDGRDAMKQWLGSLWFAPNGLQDYAKKGRKLDGIYVPFWTFDAQTHSRYRGERGTVYYETKTVQRSGKSEQKRVQKVRWRRVSGQVARWFDDVLVLASKSLPKKFTDGLQPWDLDGLEPYQPEYLAGFRAEGYTIDLGPGYQQARAIMDRRIHRDVKSDIGGDRQQVHNIQTKVSDVTFKHILLPVWMAAYKYRGKSYRFLVNGRSGQVQGQRPWSGIKIAAAVVMLAIFAAAIGFFLATQQQ